MKALPWKHNKAFCVLLRSICRWKQFETQWDLPENCQIFLSYFNRFLSRIQLKIKKKIRPVGVSLIQVDRQTDRQSGKQTRQRYQSLSAVQWRCLRMRTCIHAACGFDTTCQSSVAEGSARHRPCGYCNRQLAQITNEKLSSQLVGSVPDGAGTSRVKRQLTAWFSINLVKCMAAR